MSDTKKTFLTPLWIISIFFSFTELIAGYAVFNTVGYVQTVLLIFIIVFPVGIATGFFIVLWSRPEHFYTPSNYDKDSSFIESMNKTRKRAHLDVGVYLDTEDKEKIDKAYSALIHLVKKMNFDKESEGPSEKGSWLKRLKIKSKRLITPAELETKFKVLENQMIGQSYNPEIRKIDSQQNEAVASLLDSIKDIDSAVIRIGSLLIIKSTNKKNEAVVEVTSLNEKEMIMLEQNPDLLKNPKKLLEEVSSLNKSI